MSGKKLLIYLLLLCSIALGVELPSLHDSIATYILHQDYQGAIELIKKQPHNKQLQYIFRLPHSTKQALDGFNKIPFNSLEDSYLFLLIRNSAMVDYESYAVDGEKFEKQVDTFLSRLNKKKKLSDIEKYYKAMAQGMKGMSMIKRGSSLSGAMESRNSSKILETLLKKDSSEVSLLQSVGLSKYYMATTLNWLPFAGGKPETGLRLVGKAVSINNVHSDITRQSLIWVMIDEKKYSKAIVIADEVLSRYPKNTMVLRGKQRALLLQKKYSKAIETSQLLDSLSRIRTPQNKSDILSSGVSQVTAFKALGKKKLAKEICLEYLSIPLSKRELQIQWVQKHQKRLKALLKELQ